MKEYLLGSGAVGVVLIICAVAFLFIARRVMRVAIKAAFALTLVFVLVLTGLVGWWRGWFSSAAKPAARQTNRATPTRR
ncbi:MAG TPA: hypothetical protein VE961_20315 [Pyrinomonadaceae bacterium]|nr:hypothetical protein [Pyrinomonadaceae bacterium]